MNDDNKAIWDRLNRLESKVDNLAGQVTLVIRVLVQVVTIETVALAFLAGVTTVGRIAGFGP